MKMGVGLFWGIVVMLIGLGIIFNVVFKMNLPVLKVIFGLIFVFIGFKIIFSGSGWAPCHRGSDDVIFHQKTIKGLAGEKKEYNVVFGKAVIDLRDIELKENLTEIEVNSIFSGAEILLSKATPVKIIADVVFGGARLPDNNAGGFGTSTFKSEGLNENENYLLIKVNAIFAGVEIKYQ
ncbi:hypothetical protein KAR10_07025 [bacterium]|nr:hypothetical protein [bacterium]